jgi:hypothetical protein
MSLIKNGYGGIITGGLGLPACQGMITMHFHLFTLRVEPPPSGGGGGGGPYPPSTSTGTFYTPQSRSYQHTKYVTVHIDFKNGKKWKQQYIVGTLRADIIIKVSGWINTMQSKVRVGVDNIKRAGRAVSAMFTKEDK